MKRNQIQVLPGVTVDPTATNPRYTLRQRVGWLCLDAVAIFFWAYALIKLFVFDIDVYLLGLVAPHWGWVLNYKFPILLGLIAIAMLATKSLVLGLSTLYVVFFPLVILIWKIPKFVLQQKSWLLAFSIVNGTIAFFYSFRRDFILATFFLISTILIITTSNFFVLGGAASVLIAISVFAYFMAFRKALKPSAIFQVYTKLFTSVRSWKSLQLDESLRDLPATKFTEKQIELRTSSLENIVLFNRACLFVSKKLRNYQRSGMNVISYVFGLVFLLVITVVNFGFVNYAIFKVDPHLYQFTYSHSSLFAFIYYSAGSMFYAANGLVPVGLVSQAVQLLQFFCGVLLIVILITVIVTLRNEKYSFELEQVIATVEKEGRAAEDVLRSDYNYDSIDAAIGALEKAKTNMVAVIVYLTNNLGDEHPLRPT